MKRTGSEIIAEYLIKEGVPYALGIPGHGAISMFDPFLDRSDRIRMLQVRHEQSAVHFADAYCRVSGQPLAVFTSIGPGATNTAIGLATAYLDSIPVLVFTGAVHTHMAGRGVLQELEQQHWGNFPRMLEPVVKRYWSVNHTEQLPFVLHRAFNEMLTGRRGPVYVDMPMDVQSAAADVEIPEPIQRKPQGRMGADAEAIARVAEMMLAAKRPVILAGGGAISSGASQELQAVAEHLGAAVITTFMAKGAISEDHELCGWLTGSVGTTCGNKLANASDLILAVGTRFADLACSSYVPGAAFSIPPTKLIHIDIDPGEIGKNYPTEIGIVADAKAALAALLEALRERERPRAYRESAYFREIQALRAEWFDLLSPLWDSDAVPVAIPRVFRELRSFLDDDAIVVTSAGNSQGHLMQGYAFRVPGTNLTSGGFSTMGFTLPAAMGAKMAAPDRQVVGVAGDGDFLMTIQELAMAAQYRIPVVMVVVNNIGWGSIRNLQIGAHGPDRTLAVDFRTEEGELISPDFAEVARAFGVRGERIERPEEVRPALERAFDSGMPTVIEVTVNRALELSAALPTGGWWDVPTPEYLEGKRAEYMAQRMREQLG